MDKPHIFFTIFLYFKGVHPSGDLNFGNVNHLQCNFMMIIVLCSANSHLLFCLPNIVAIQRFPHFLNAAPVMGTGIMMTIFQKVANLRNCKLVVCKKMITDANNLASEILKDRNYIQGLLFAIWRSMVD